MCLVFQLILRVVYRMLILGGTLDLIYGRRYGFVGRNGLGRSNFIECYCYILSSFL